MNGVVALLTPVGRGAVATVAVCGPDAVELVNPLFRAASGKRLHDAPLERIVFGRWFHAGKEGEELVVCRRAEQRIEIHCHGGITAARAIVDQLVDAGGREVPWFDPIVVGDADRIAIDARRAIAEARSERTAGILLDQLHGALKDELIAIENLLRGGEVAEAIQRMDALLRWRTLGSHLTKPWRVVLAGAPNVGKSSLINALLGYQRSIVLDQPGTTRDVVTATTMIEGWPVEFADTAGLRAAKDAIEVEGIERARQTIQAADLLLLVRDEASPDFSNWESLGISPRKLVFVQNKCDLGSSKLGSLPDALPSEMVRTSAKLGDGVRELLATIVQRLVPESPAPKTAIPFTAQQVGAIEAARSAAVDHQTDLAADRLRGIWDSSAERQTFDAT